MTALGCGLATATLVNNGFIDLRANMAEGIAQYNMCTVLTNRKSPFIHSLSVPDLDRNSSHLATLEKYS